MTEKGFKSISIEDADLLSQYYRNCTYQNCEYSTGIKVFWNKFYPYEYTIQAGCLIIKYESNNHTNFDYPVCGPNGDINKALDFIDSYCSENCIVPLFSDVPDDGITVLANRYPHVDISKSRGLDDYIYKANEVITFSGKKFSGQRNHINKFNSVYPNHIFRPVKPQEDLTAFFSEFKENLKKENQDTEEELEVAEAMSKNWWKVPGMFAGCMEVEGKIVSVSIGEITGNTMIIHIEKALSSFSGIYPAVFSSFVSLFASQDVVFVNREEDNYDKGLRTSKTQYKPCLMLSKKVISVHSLLENIKDIPMLKTERLVLDSITANDITDYNKLCLDESLNKYWGYDYHEDLKGELTENFFVDTAKEDFENHVCINFAIRYQNSFIGELVFYNEDFKGSVELGCRLLNSFQHKGFALEAIKKAIDWALYDADFSEIKAKCFKENIPSFNLLSKIMNKSHEDDTYFYFNTVY